MFVHTQRERCKTVVIACGGLHGQEVIGWAAKGECTAWCGCGFERPALAVDRPAHPFRAKEGIFKCLLFIDAF